MRDRRSEYEATITRSDGFFPKNQAGKATEAHSDLRFRGGTLMIRRRISPDATCASLCVIASRCQFGRKGMPGRITSKAYRVNDIRCSANIARKSTCGEYAAGAALWISSMVLSLVLRLNVVVQQLCRSQHRRTLRDEVVLLCDVLLEHGLMVGRERLLKRLLLDAQKVQTHSFGQCK